MPKIPNQLVDFFTCCDIIRSTKQPIVFVNKPVVCRLKRFRRLTRIPRFLKVFLEVDSVRWPGLLVVVLLLLCDECGCVNDADCEVLCDGYCSFFECNLLERLGLRFGWVEVLQLFFFRSRLKIGRQLSWFAGAEQLFSRRGLN